VTGHAVPGGERPGTAAGAAGRPDPAPAAPRWGFCGECEQWRLSADWGDPPACPVCGARPGPVERWADGAYRLELTLDLPPGTDLPLLG
jgi:hypothetical protein